jgi:predicted solute-binding protein
MFTRVKNVTIWADAETGDVHFSVMLPMSNFQVHPQDFAEIVPLILKQDVDALVAHEATFEWQFDIT